MSSMPSGLTDPSRSAWVRSYGPQASVRRKSAILALLAGGGAFGAVALWLIVHWPRPRHALATSQWATRCGASGRPPGQLQELFVERSGGRALIPLAGVRARLPPLPRPGFGARSRTRLGSAGLHPCLRRRDRSAPWGGLRRDAAEALDSVLAVAPVDDAVEVHALQQRPIAQVVVLQLVQSRRVHLAVHVDEVSRHARI